MASSFMQHPGVPRPVRAVLAVGALALVLWMVAGALLSYQSASRGSRAGEATSTPAPSTQATDTGSQATNDGARDREGEGAGSAGAAVVVLVDGLNLREQPSTGARVIKRLQAGQRLLFIEEGNGWYHVRDVDGSDGWVAAGGSYTRLEK